jgi:hypothetical protein
MAADLPQGNHVQMAIAQELLEFWHTKALQIEPGAADRSETGFAWRPLVTQQRVWCDPGFSADAVTAHTEIDVWEAAGEWDAAVVDSVNDGLALGAATIDVDGVLRLHFSLPVHSDTARNARDLVSWIAALQVADAHDLQESGCQGQPGQPAVREGSVVNASGDVDSIIGVRDMLRTASEESRELSVDASIRLAVAERFGPIAEEGADSLAFSYPWPIPEAAVAALPFEPILTTSLFGGIHHPLLGPGVGVVTGIPGAIDPALASAVALALNEAPRHPEQSCGVGTCRSDRYGQLRYQAFYPVGISRNVDVTTAHLVNIVNYLAIQSSSVPDAVEGVASRS